MLTIILIVKMLMNLVADKKKLSIIYCCVERLRGSYYGEDQRWVYLFKRFLGKQPCWLENIILALDTEADNRCHCTPDNSHWLAYRLTDSATHMQMFLSLKDDLRSLCLSDEDIDYIATKCREDLAQRGRANLFLVEDKDEGRFIVKDVRLYADGGYYVHAHRGLWDRGEWEEHHHARIIVKLFSFNPPPYTFRPVSCLK